MQCQGETWSTLKSLACQACRRAPGLGRHLRPLQVGTGQLAAPENDAAGQVQAGLLQHAWRPTAQHVTTRVASLQVHPAGPQPVVQCKGPPGPVLLLPVSLQRSRSPSSPASTRCRVRGHQGTRVVMACLDSENCIAHCKPFGWDTQALLCLKSPSLVDHALLSSMQRAVAVCPLFEHSVSCYRPPYGYQGPAPPYGAMPGMAGPPGGFPPRPGMMPGPPGPGMSGPMGLPPGGLQGDITHPTP